jgi:hypothetical protein
MPKVREFGLSPLAPPMVRTIDQTPENGTLYEMQLSLSLPAIGRMAG